MNSQNPLHDLSPEQREMMENFYGLRCRYQAALREVQTKLEILDDEFQMRHSRNPIHHMESRIKRPESVVEKLVRKGLPVSVQSAEDNLRDIAGIRVVCAYLNDVYTLADLLTSQDDITLLQTRDYIKTPKPNGYRSLHLIVQVPVFLSTGKTLLPVEVQIRTIAMDFWASLEHHLRYKETSAEVPEALNRQLYEAAEKIAALDGDMQHIYDQMLALTLSARSPQHT